MLILGVIASLALLAAIIRFALSPQTDRLVRRAALIALAVIALALVVCLIVLITGPDAVEEEEVFAGLPLAETVPVSNPNKGYMLIMGLIMLLFVGLIIFLSLREERKKRSARSSDQVDQVKRPG
jgi:small-conductance mechanosensitive channel